MGRVFKNHGEKCDMVIRWSSRRVVAVCSDLLDFSSNGNHTEVDIWFVVSCGML